MEIIIATKGRYRNNKFLTWLDQNFGGHTTLFVEPAELDSYKFAFPNTKIENIFWNDRGLTYVRNIIYKYTIEHNIDYFWMPDDDITGFFKKVGNRVEKIEWELVINRLMDMEKEFIKEGFAHAGLEYQQFAWSATKPYVLNSFVDAVVWFNMPILKQIIRTTQPYKYELKLKVDRDFCMQVLAAGGTTARSTELSLSMPKEGSNTGGLKEIAYDIDHLEESMVDKLIELWGTDKVTKITKDNGRIDAKIHWDRLRPIQTPGLYEGLF